MTRIAPLVALLSALCWAQSEAAPAYPINVHVSSSQWVVIPTTLGPQSVLKLAVVINGKKYELEAEARGRIALLNLGDYKAKLTEDIHKTPYQSTQTYEFLFSDQKTMKFAVVGQNE